MARAIGVGAVIVAKHQRVFAFFMLKKVENAVLFHEPGYKVEIRLAVLDTVFSRLVGSFSVSEKSWKPRSLKTCLMISGMVLF